MAGDPWPSFFYVGLHYSLGASNPVTVPTPASVESIGGYYLHDGV